MSDNAGQKLAHVIWQTAKFLVSLLEKEFGLGKGKTSAG